MLTIEYVPSVLAALESAFPKPPNRAKQQLDKYLALLERLMRFSLLKRSPLAHKYNAYDIPLTKLINGSPTINNKKWRVHEWLGKHGHALVKNINKSANNITKEIAVLKPTANLIVKNDNLLKYLQSLTALELDAYLNSLTQDWQDLVADYQSHYHSLSAKDRKSQYFTSPVDIAALKRYMTGLVQGSTALNKYQQENTIVQAEYVLRLAQVSNGLLHQKIDKKAFGRTYYEGVSVLSTRKELRMAFLGTSWEYDCKSCSTSWKMAFAAEWHAQKKSRKLDVRQSFAAMTLYLEDKEAFFDAVILEVYNSQPTQECKDTIKSAMTALGFGAKLSMGTWRSDTGEESQSSLFEVFEKDAVALKRFIDCYLVKKFNAEQQTLNKFIVAKFSVDAVWQAEMAAEQQRKKVKQFSSAQKIVWLYQHAETIMMDMVRAEVKKSGNTVLANVHDAVVVRNQISAKLLATIERKVQQRTGVSYFRLGETGY
ncbi:hypothetical protein [Limnohabitans sp. Hippo4]|uniref:hypothetical protein n=1 Tax=Limnohabitans sp. Hippo4 TaxID=1826167 RepID=UPI001304CDF0|nr:hypothetical protein [Limnohabitans sp. Hippo4]